MSYFRRNSFHTVVSKPKWHVFDHQEGSKFFAICGYEYKFILDTPLLKDEIKTLNLVCKNCKLRATNQTLSLTSIDSHW